VEVGARVDVLVRNAGGTYVAAGAEADLSPSTISAWDRGLRWPRPESLRKLRAAS
jgi:hypothetical protein